MSAPSMLPGLWIVLALAAVLDAAGVYLLLTALRRREGRTPFCRGCGYNLTGTLGVRNAAAGAAATPTEPPVPRCPECGIDVGESRIQFGERRVRQGRVAAGLLLTSLSSLVIVLHVTGILARVDVYRLYPAAWLLEDVAASDERAAGRAFNELQRRCLAGGLTEPQLNQLVEASLEIQDARKAKAPLTGWRASLPKLLDWLHRNGAMSAEQSRRFFETMVTWDFTVRPRIGRDQPLVSEIDYDYCGPRDQYAVIADDIEVTVDGVLVARVGRGAPVGGFMPARTGSGIRFQLPVGFGPHEVVARVPFEIRRLLPNGKVDGEPLHQEVRVMRRTTEALLVEKAELVRLVRSPELDRRMVEAITLNLLEFRGRDGYWTAIGTIKLAEDAPLAIAHRVTFEFPAGHHALARTGADRHVEISPGRPGSLIGLIGSDASGSPGPKRVTITLTPDLEYAASTPDLFEIWGGTLRFEDVGETVADVFATSSSEGWSAPRGKLVELTEPAP